MFHVDPRVLKGIKGLESVRRRESYNKYSAKLGKDAVAINWLARTSAVPWNVSLHVIHSKLNAH